MASPRKPRLPEGDELLWQAYGQFVRRELIGTGKLTPGTDYIYISPPTESAIRGGKPFPDAVTNWDVYGIADSLQPIDQPSFSIAGEGTTSYIDSLELYLSNIKLGVIDPAKQKKIDDAIEAQAALEEKVDGLRDTYEARWRRDPDAKKNRVPFIKWCITHAPSYLDYRKKVATGAGQIQSMKNEAGGAEADLVAQKLRKITFLAKADDQSNPQFNMPIFGDDYDPNAKDPRALANDLRNEDIPGDRLTYLPSYAVEGYEEACDRWIKGQAGANTIWQLDLTKSTHSDWTQFGHTSKAAAASASVLFFFSASAGGSSDVKTLDFRGKDWRKDTKVSISMQGQPQAFSLRAGAWDVPGARHDYPVLNAGRVDIGAGLVRPKKILVGYGVSLSITVSSSLRTQVQSMYNEVKQSGGRGGLNIFGFRFGGSAGSKHEVRRNLNEVHYDQSSHTFTTPPTPPGVPVLLGVLCRKIGS